MRGDIDLACSLLEFCAESVKVKCVKVKWLKVMGKCFGFFVFFKGLTQGKYNKPFNSAVLDL